MIEIVAEASQFIPFAVEADPDLSTGTVSVGFAPPGGGRPSSYPLNGAWINPGLFRVLYTPNLLGAGEWAVWARFSDSPEIFPKHAGTIRIV